MLRAVVVMLEVVTDTEVRVGTAAMLETVAKMVVGVGEEVVLEAVDEVLFGDCSKILSGLLDDTSVVVVVVDDAAEVAVGVTVERDSDNLGAKVMLGSGDEVMAEPIEDTVVVAVGTILEIDAVGVLGVGLLLVECFFSRLTPINSIPLSENIFLVLSVQHWSISLLIDS